MRVRARPLRGGIRNRCTVYADLILIIHNYTGSLSILKHFTFGLNERSVNSEAFAQ